jgi:DnaJ-class molecular chaperone
MVNSKKRRHSAICNDCNGNGYTSNKSREIIIQCETCDSEGEIYVDESEIVDVYVDDDIAPSDVGKLH